MVANTPNYSVDSHCVCRLKDLWRVALCRIICELFLFCLPAAAVNLPIQTLAAIFFIENNHACHPEITKSVFAEVTHVFVLNCVNYEFTSETPDFEGYRVAIKFLFMLHLSFAVAGR